MEARKFYKSYKKVPYRRKSCNEVGRKKGTIEGGMGGGGGSVGTQNPSKSKRIQLNSTKYWKCLLSRVNSCFQYAYAVIECFFSIGHLIC